MVEEADSRETAVRAIKKSVKQVLSEIDCSYSSFSSDLGAIQFGLKMDGVEVGGEDMLSTLLGLSKLFVKVIYYETPDFVKDVPFDITHKYLIKVPGAVTRIPILPNKVFGTVEGDYTIGTVLLEIQDMTTKDPKDTWGLVELPKTAEDRIYSKLVKLGSLTVGYNLP